MSKRLTIAEINSRLIKINFQCLEENYRTPNLKMKFKCNKGHIFKATWRDVQTLQYCPVCKYGEDCYLKQLDKKKDKKESYYYKDENGRIFNSQREYQKFRRQEKSITVPHEMIIESLHNKFPISKKYKFKKAVLKALIRESAIGIMKYNEYIPQDVTPNAEVINAELKTMYCSLSDARVENCKHKEECRANNCSCEEEKLTLYDLLYQGCIGEIVDDICFIPDLFILDEDNFKIIAIEVEDTHRVPVSKLVRYALFQDHLDWWLPEWQFDVVIFDRFENNLGFINLPVYYLASFKNDFKDNFRKYLEEIEKKIPRFEKELIGYYHSTTF
jgi:hypothetical protein